MALVTERVAACANIVPGLQSVYTWQGRCERAPEWLLIIKTRIDQYQALEARIRALHPYDVPQIVAVPIVRGFADYLAWIDESVGEIT
jgi:periplasmic divalent cation tolerance protein